MFIRISDGDKKKIQRVIGSLGTGVSGNPGTECRKVFPVEDSREQIDAALHKMDVQAAAQAAESEKS